MEKTMRRWRRLWGILGALCLVIGSLSGCGGAMPQETESKVATETMASEVPATEEKETLPENKGKAEAGTSADETGSEAGAAVEETKGSEESGTPKSSAGSKAETEEFQELSVDESGSYTGKDEVALYLHLYGHLPDNYITKREAENLGWNSKEGNLWEVAPGMSIGGSRFGNYEGLLPDKTGRQYYECDIDFDGGYRGAKRIIYSDDGLIFYTEDHYKTFQQLYGE